MTATIRQTAANRENAKRSTGPKSPEGKEKARRNALKHGLAGHGIVLPDETEEQIQSQMSIWSQGYKGWDDRDMAMIEQVAVEHLRVLECQRIDREIRITQCFRAHTHWDVDCRKEAKDLFDKLHRNPMIHAIRLESTLHGCELLIERWVGLLSGLENGKPWDEIHRDQALDALGVARDFRDVRTKIDAYPGQVVLDVQKRVAESEIKRLKEFKDDFLIEDDEDLREQTMVGLGLINHPTTLIRRYEAACKRRFQAALKWIDASRKRGGKPAPKNYPTGEDLRRYNEERLAREAATEPVFKPESIMERVSAIYATIAEMEAPSQAPVVLPTPPVSPAIALIDSVDLRPLPPVCEAIVKTLAREAEVRRATRPTPSQAKRARRARNKAKRQSKKG